MVPSAQLFKDNQSAQTALFSAPFAFSLVPEGRYLISGFIDHDECGPTSSECLRPDFLPWFSVTAEPNAGDVGAAAIDLVTEKPEVIRISPDGESLTAATNVTVSASDTAAVRVDRPVFWVSQGEGDVVTVASTSGMKGGVGGTSYGASKWAVRGLTQSWQAELRPHGIRVTCVCPSEVQTDFDGKTGRNSPHKLFAVDIAGTIMAALDMPRRVLWPELAVFATNPWAAERKGS